MPPVALVLPCKHYAPAFRGSSLPTRPRFWWPLPAGSESAGYYSTAPLQRTLEELVDFSRINRGGPRLTVGAALLRTSQMRYFDSRDTAIDVRHILASGALPPAFPAVRIDGELYWDGGILSNTPAETIFDDYPRYDSLVFAVHLWNPVGAEPQSMWEVAHRQKDIQYSSRVANHIARQSQLHRLRHVIEELSDLLPADILAQKRVQELVANGCPTRMHFVRLMAPRLDHDDQTKDVDFSPSAIRTRWKAGYDHARSAIDHAPWQAEFNPLEGVILHEPNADGNFAPAPADARHHPTPTPVAAVPQPVRAA